MQIRQVVGNQDQGVVKVIVFNALHHLVHPVQRPAEAVDGATPQAVAEFLGVAARGTRGGERDPISVFTLASTWLQGHVPLGG